MEWWAWIIAGIALLVVEFSTPGGFISLFFGVGALLVGLLVGLGFGGPEWLQWLLFPIFSVALLFPLRRFFKDRLVSRTKPVDSLIGEIAVCLHDMGPEAPGKVELRGSTWNAQTQHPLTLHKGQRCVVERVDGLTLWIRPQP